METLEKRQAQNVLPFVSVYIQLWLCVNHPEKTSIHEKKATIIIVAALIFITRTTDAFLGVSLHILSLSPARDRPVILKSSSSRYRCPEDYCTRRLSSRVQFKSQVPQRDALSSPGVAGKVHRLLVITWCWCVLVSLKTLLFSPCLTKTNSEPYAVWCHVGVLGADSVISVCFLYALTYCLYQECTAENAPFSAVCL